MSTSCCGQIRAAFPSCSAFRWLIKETQVKQTTWTSLDTPHKLWHLPWSCCFAVVRESSGLCCCCCCCFGCCSLSVCLSKSVPLCSPRTHKWSLDHCASFPPPRKVNNPPQILTWWESADFSWYWDKLRVRWYKYMCAYEVCGTKRCASCQEAWLRITLYQKQHARQQQIFLPSCVEQLYLVWGHAGHKTMILHFVESLFNLWGCTFTVVEYIKQFSTIK